MATIRTDLGDFNPDAVRVRSQAVNGIAHTNVQKALEQIATSPPSIVETQVNVTPYEPGDSETFLGVKTSAGAITINLKVAVSRGGVPLVIKDVDGQASMNNITIVPNGAETIDGLPNLTLNVDYGGVRLSPKAGVGWRVSP